MSDIALSARVVSYLRSLDEAVSLDALAKYLVTDEARDVAEQWLAVYPGLSRHVALRCRYMESQVARCIEAGAP